jgi:hypothetical protein
MPTHSRWNSETGQLEDLARLCASDSECDSDTSDEAHVVTGTQTLSDARVTVPPPPPHPDESCDDPTDHESDSDYASDGARNPGSHDEADPSDGESLGSHTGSDDSEAAQVRDEELFACWMEQLYVDYRYRAHCNTENRPVSCGTHLHLDDTHEQAIQYFEDPLCQRILRLKTAGRQHSQRVCSRLENVVPTLETAMRHWADHRGFGACVVRSRYDARALAARMHTSLVYSNGWLERRCAWYDKHAMC